MLLRLWASANQCVTLARRLPDHGHRREGRQVPSLIILFVASDAEAETPARKRQRSKLSKWPGHRGRILALG